jgi:hypothetical protein
MASVVGHHPTCAVDLWLLCQGCQSLREREAQQEGKNESERCQGQRERLRGEWQRLIRSDGEVGGEAGFDKCQLCRNHTSAQK